MRKFYSIVFNSSAFKNKSPKWILGLFVVLLGFMPGRTLGQVNSITLNSISTTSVCPGGNLDVNFSSTTTGTITYTYTAQLSDNTGSFTTPVNIGSVDISGDANNNIIPATIPAGTAAGTGYLIRVFSGAATSGNSPSITVNPNLPVSVSIAINAPNTNTICAGTSVTFTAKPTPNGGSPSYQWYVGGTLVGSGSTFTSSTLANADQVKVVMTPDPTSCTSAATATSNVITMTVNNQVTPTVSISANPGNTICPGQSVTFSASSIINGGSNPSYQWKLNGSVVASTPTYTTSTLINGDIVSLDLTPSAACAVPATVSSNQITMAVNPGTPATPGSITGTAAVCPGIAGLTYSITAV